MFTKFVDTKFRFYFIVLPKLGNQCQCNASWILCFSNLHHFTSTRSSFFMNTCQDDLQDLFGVSGRDHRVSRLPAPGSSSGSPQAKSWNNRQPPPNFPHQKRTQVSVVASFLCSILRNIHLRTKTHSFVFPFHLFLTSCIFVTFQHVSCPLAILLLFDG